MHTVSEVDIYYMNLRNSKWRIAKAGPVATAYVDPFSGGIRHQSGNVGESLYRYGKNRLNVNQNNVHAEAVRLDVPEDLLCLIASDWKEDKKSE